MKKGEGEHNCDPAKVWKVAIFDTSARCQLPQTHSRCLPSVPHGAAQRPSATLQGGHHDGKWHWAIRGRDKTERAQIRHQFAVGVAPPEATGESAGSLACRRCCQPVEQPRHGAERSPQRSRPPIVSKGLGSGESD